VLSVESGNQIRVAVKAFRVILNEDEEKRAMRRELTIWSDLHHANILSIIDTTEVNGLPAFVSEWMNNGTVKQYQQNNPDACVLKLVRRFITLVPSSCIIVSTG
jgi:hypothetical protein